MLRGMAADDLVSQGTRSTAWMAFICLEYLMQTQVATFTNMV